MATDKTTANTEAKRAKREPVSVKARVRTQLATAVLRNKISTPELEELKALIDKLIALA